MCVLGFLFKQLVEIQPVVYGIAVMWENHSSDFFLAGNTGGWSTDGCDAVLDNASTITCECNHLTSFTVLLVSSSCIVTLLYGVSLLEY